MDHDRLFKEPLTTFFFEFLELFFPALIGCIDRSQAPIFLDKESFGQSKRRREVELFSFPEPLTKQPDRYQMTVAGRRVLDFRYAALQLNR